jgi:CheY-like chemotaxis protein
VRQRPEAEFLSDIQTKKVLLIDDDIDVLDFIIERFQSENDGKNIAIVAVDTAAKALAAMKTTHFDAIVTDLYMPDMNGKEFVAKVRQSGSEIPILMLTAYLANTENDDVIATGVDVLLEKPGHINKIVRATAILASSGKRPNWNDEP